MNKTFYQGLVHIASESYKSKLPALRSQAPHTASRGLDELRSEVEVRGNPDLEVEVTTEVGHLHIEEFAEMVREHVPVDVRVVVRGNMDSGTIRLVFAGGYVDRAKMGKVEYDFLVWSATDKGVRHNLLHLRGLGQEGGSLSQFERILEMFDCMDGEVKRVHMHGDTVLMDKVFGAVVMNKVLNWSQENVSVAARMSDGNYTSLFWDMMSGAMVNVKSIKSVEESYKILKILFPSK